MVGRSLLNVRKCRSWRPADQPWVCSGFPARARWASPTASDWGGVRVDELRDLGRQRLPVVDELGLGDEVPHAEPTMWTPSTGPSLAAITLTATGGTEALARPLPAKVVDGLDGVVAALLGLSGR